MKGKRKEPTAPVQESSCPLPLTPEERQKVVAAWLESIPPDILAEVEGLRAVEVGIALGPSFMCQSTKKLRKPGRPFVAALNLLAGPSGIMRQGHVRMSDGQVLCFEPHTFLSRRAAPAPEAGGGEP